MGYIGYFCCLSRKKKFVIILKIIREITHIANIGPPIAAARNLATLGSDHMQTASYHQPCRYRMLVVMSLWRRTCWIVSRSQPFWTIRGAGVCLKRTQAPHSSAKKNNPSLHGPPYATHYLAYLKYWNSLNLRYSLFTEISVFFLRYSICFRTLCYSARFVSWDLISLPYHYNRRFKNRWG
jgi:hypothetical protein